MPLQGNSPSPRRPGGVKCVLLLRPGKSVFLVRYCAGFSFSAGATDLLFSASLPAAQKTWLILPLGLAAFAVFFLVFRLMIPAFHFKTPGNEDEDTETQAEAESAETQTTEHTPAPKAESAKAPELVAGCDVDEILAGLGGRENILTLDNCATRLRPELKDMSLVDEKRLKSAGAKGVMKPGGGSVQVVIGVKVQSVADALREKMKLS